MKFAYLTISDPDWDNPPPHEDHSQGAVAVNNGWDFPPIGGEENPNYASIEAGVGVFAHRRNPDGSPAYDRDGDGLNDPILWSSHNPPGAGFDHQFSFEGWAYPDVTYRFELIEVAPQQFRMWINGLESNLTWYGGWPPDQYPRGPRYIPSGAPWPPYQMDVFGEDNSHEDLVCDEFDIGVVSVNPPLTEYNYDSPWTFCLGPNVGPPWTRGEFWPSFRSPSYSSLCTQFGPFVKRLLAPAQKSSRTAVRQPVVPRP